ncbi:histone-fold-containing protein [Lipomyces oligophaga]|uniref:histone-fold-containing protein n=1 Tax=Lipomyces oligophaga TaxID=45792 RepID=UPI0034CF3B14
MAEEIAEEEAKGKESSGIEDYMLPKITVNRLAKAVLPAHSQIQRDAQTAISKSATVFINYLTASANQFTQQSGRKAISHADVFDALKVLGLEFFVPRLQQEVDMFLELASNRRKAYNLSTTYQEQEEQSDKQKENGSKRAKTESNDVSQASRNDDTESETSPQDTVDDSDSTEDLEENDETIELEDSVETGTGIHEDGIMTKDVDALETESDDEFD